MDYTKLDQKDLNSLRQDLSVPSGIKSISRRLNPFTATHTKKSFNQTVELLLCSARRSLRQSTSESIHLLFVVYRVEYCHNHGDGNTILAAAVRLKQLSP